MTEQPEDHIDDIAIDPDDLDGVVGGASPSGSLAPGLPRTPSLPPGPGAGGSSSFMPVNPKPVGH